jgi:hypothetical protein
MKTIDIANLETVTGGTKPMYRRMTTTLDSGFAASPPAVLGVDLVEGGAVLKANRTFTIEKGSTINLTNEPKGKHAR